MPDRQLLLPLAGIRALLAAIERGASGAELDAICGAQRTRQRWTAALADEAGVRIEWDPVRRKRRIADWGIFRRSRMLASEADEPTP